MDQCDYETLGYAVGGRVWKVQSLPQPHLVPSSKSQPFLVYAKH